MPDTNQDPARDEQEEQQIRNIAVSHAYVRCSKEAVASTKKQVFEARLVVDSALSSIQSLRLPKPVETAEKDENTD